MSSSPVILELGSQSLKLHYQSPRSGVFRKARFSWDLGHEVYSNGSISQKTLRTALETIHDLRSRGFHPRNLLAIATGALRDARNRKVFIRQLEDKLGVEVRVISGQEEASLLAHGYLRSYKTLPALITDIGGGSLEIVYLGADRTILRDSLPLGAIRLHYLGLDELEDHDGHSRWNEDLVTGFIRSHLEDASLLTAGEIYTTGGTGKAVWKVLGKTGFGVEDLEGLVDDMRRNGPPSGIKPDRARVFFPGVLVLLQLLVHSRARCMTYLKIPAGRIFLQRMVQKTAPGADADRKRFMLRNMRITTIRPTLSSFFPAGRGDAGGTDRPQGQETQDRQEEEEEEEGQDRQE